jgi:hypothetical protein
VVEDLPPDVRAVLAQLFAEGREALAADDRGTAIETVTTAETVATNKLPEGALRDRLLHGCGRVRRLLDAGVGASREDGDPPDGERTDAAAAYLAAMERRVEDANGE